MNTDRTLVDDYLKKWDQFGQGDKALVPFLRENKSQFESALTRLLKSHDRGAVARLIFYPVVQVGGAIPVDSELGTAACEELGVGFPIMTKEDGKKVLFCADLYFWWKAHASEFEAFQTFDTWLGRDFAKTTVIPMYEGLQHRKK